LSILFNNEEKRNNKPDLGANHDLDTPLPDFAAEETFVAEEDAPVKSSAATPPDLRQYLSAQSTLNLNTG
jgi:hypothetical protein